MKTDMIRGAIHALPDKQGWYRLYAGRQYSGVRTDWLTDVFLFKTRRGPGLLLDATMDAANRGRR